MCVLRKCPWQHPLRRCVVLVHVHLPSESALPGCLFRRLIFLRNVCVEELWTRSPPEKRPEESVVHGLELRVVRPYRLDPRDHPSSRRPAPTRAIRPAVLIHRRESFWPRPHACHLVRASRAGPAPPG